MVEGGRPVGGQFRRVDERIKWLHGLRRDQIVQPPARRKHQIGSGAGLDGIGIALRQIVIGDNGKEK